MPEQSYQRPPITEAVIEIRFATPAESGEVGKSAGALETAYARQVPVANYVVKFELSQNTVNEPTTRADKALGRQLSSNDQTERVLIWPQSLVVAQLAPYPGWHDFFGRFARDWKLWKKAMSCRQIQRVGLRFINRIDIPRPSAAVIEGTNYLGVFANLPAQLGPVSAYGVQAQFPPDENQFLLTLNSATVPSPILENVAILLDLDLGRDIDPPQKDDDLYALLHQMRVKKNAVFEACITDRARELFQR